MKKTFEAYLAFIEDELGLQLLSYQKEMLRKLYEKPNLYIIWPPSYGRTYFNIMFELHKELMKEN